MSDDLAVLQQLLDEWGRGEFWNEGAYAEDVVFVVAGPDAAEYHGREQLAAAWRDFLSAWNDFHVESERVVPGTDGAYALLIRLRARGKGSGIDTDAEVANVVRMRDGHVAHLEMYWNREAALRAAGTLDGTE